MGQNRPNFCVRYAKKVHLLENSTPLPVVAVVTNMSYGRSLTSNVIERRSNQYWLVQCNCVLSKCVYNRTWHFWCITNNKKKHTKFANNLVEIYIVTNIGVDFFVFLVCRFWGIPSQNHNRNIQCVNIYMKTACNIDIFFIFIVDYSAPLYIR